MFGKFSTEVRTRFEKGNQQSSQTCACLCIPMICRFMHSVWFPRPFLYALMFSTICAHVPTSYSFQHGCVLTVSNSLLQLSMCRSSYDIRYLSRVFLVQVLTLLRFIIFSSPGRHPRLHSEATVVRTTFKIVRPNPWKQTDENKKKNQRQD